IVSINEDTIPGELSNVTAGRVANIFNLNGPNMTFDAACASSLAALDYAVLGLRAGKFDMAVCGGADEMMSPPAYVKFCKIGALSEDGSWVFDERANGFVMAESVAVYILKRYTDAVRDNDNIYALINAVGASSDGKGKGITAPNPNGQKLAIKNTFDQLDYTPADIQLIEAHGTATKAGDTSELQVLQELYSDLSMPLDSVALGSVKSQIGHTKAAAGAVSMVKTTLALHNKILPPSINFKNLNKIVDFSKSPLRVITKAEEWKTDKVRRANVSSFGFGGANFHVALEEYLPGKTTAYTKETAAETYNMPNTEVIEDASTPFAGLQGEAVTFSAPTGLALVNQMQSLKDSTISSWGEPHPMAPFAIPSNEREAEAFGVSIVSKSPKDLQAKIDLFAKSFKDDVFTKPPLTFKLRGMYPFKKTELKTKIGFLFPGQGSQYVDMMRDLAAKYKVVQDTFDEADVILKKMINIKLTDVLWSKPNEIKEDLEKREAAIKQTQMTQPAVLTADVAMMRLLQSYGINPDMAAGHSLGEYAAATASGVFSFENGLKAVTSRAKEMSKVKVKDPGKMASIAWSFEKVEKEIRKIKGYIICANKNCPVQTVIAGEADAVDTAVKMFGEQGIQAQIIPVSHAFHSEIIEPAMGPYREFLEAIPISSSKIPLLSNVTADYFPTNKQGIYDLLIKQMVSPVEFIKQLERMYADGVRTFIEVGPKRVLSAFTTATLKDKKDIRILSSNHPKRGGITEFNDLLANLISLGYKLNWDEKTPKPANTFYNPYYLNWSNKQQGIGERGEGRETNTIGASHNITANTPESIDALEMVKKFGFNFNNIAFSGIASGAPGTWGKLFREESLDEILDGKNMIEPIDESWRKDQIDKDIIRVVKSATGNHKIEAIDSTEHSIKLSARNGEFDIEKEFGLPPTIAKALTSPFRMSLAAGVLALKDAGVPLMHYYKKTSTGSYLPEKWALPDDIAKDTGVIFASAFPVVEALIDEVTNYFNKKYSGKDSNQMWDIYDSIISKLSDSKDKQNMRRWMEENFNAAHNSKKQANSREFSQNFLLKIIPIADSQFAQWVGAKGPAMHISAACASTTQAVHTAETWIRAGRAKRVVIIAADDITNKTAQDWTMAGFIASGAATTTEKLSEAALPFDKRRHGLIVGSGAVGIVVEDETLVKERGMVPLARLLLSESANSAFHATKLDTNHVSSIMENFVKKVENIYGINKKDFAHKMVFLSHETYTPARGGSASAEVKALKKAFGEYADKIIVSNVKGFTGHTMGASLEDIVAVRSLNTGIIPPIANYKEPDPELAGITLSKGGQYNPEFALRFAAGFGSHMAMSLIQKTYTAGQPRIEDSKNYTDWLKQISGDDNAELEVVFNTLRIKDRKLKRQGKLESTGVEVRKITQPVPAPRPAPQPAPAAVSAPSVSSSPTAVAERKVVDGLDEKIKEDILNMLTDKTGYPKDMLEIDLDMEADLGIDTVKQAELFASMREHFKLPKNDNLSLKDYPTIRHCVKFVMDGKGISANADTGSTAGQLNSSATTETTTTQPSATTTSADRQPAVSSDGLDEKIKEDILNMLTDKTGYPKDMLEIDLDMEADLGIDTVK
ncbi:MAG: acyltransferase domain-containing protein, partial [Elusimicrobiota bacterium]|nr:acyltransferase domain-containing protein [Elusimicrobiota bacterium]